MLTDEVLNRLVTEKVMERVPPRSSVDVFDFQGFIEGAWLVVEKMLERGFVPLVNHRGRPSDVNYQKDWVGDWRCCFQAPGGCNHPCIEPCGCFIDAEADTPARAICLAALKACGVEIPHAD